MPGESDQTRWVGTRKVDPAIGDLQAPESFMRNLVSTVAGGGPNDLDIYTVAPGKMFVCEVVNGVSNLASPARCQMMMRKGVTDYMFYNEAVAFNWEMQIYNRAMLFDEGEILRVSFTACAGGELLYAWAFGHIIDKY